METVAIAIIATVVFGVATALAIFIHQLLLSRNKRLNDKAQQLALKQEVNELEKMRLQMESNKRFDSHYQILGANKDAIQYLDQRIENILAKKMELIERYSKVTIKESKAVIVSGPSDERKAVHELLRSEINNEMASFDRELEQLQKNRSSIWDAHSGLQEYLLEQEKKRNEKLDDIYKQHTGILEKIYIRHNENSEQLAMKTIDAGSKALSLITAPLQMLLQFFNASTNITLDKVADEYSHRQDVADAEADINQYEENAEEDYEEDPVDEALSELTN